MTNYIDSVSYLPQNLGEIYSDKSLRLVGYAKVNLSNANQIDTSGVKLLCSPTGGGSEAVTNIPDGSYILSGVGSSLWVRISRNGTNTYTPVVHPVGVAPRPSRDYIQLFYQHSIGMMGFGNQYIAQSTTYTNIGAGIGQKTFDAIVSNDITGNYTDLWTAIADLASIQGARILVRNDQSISSATTISNSNLYIEFGEGVKISSSATSGTALTFSGIGTSTKNLYLQLNGSGANGVYFTSTGQHHDNMTVYINAASVPNVFNFGVSSANNYLHGRVIGAVPTASTIISDISASPFQKTNIYSLSTPWDIQTSNARPYIRTTAMTVAANDYIYADTTGGTPGSPAFSITLPTSAVLGDRIWVVDYKYNFAVSGVTISRNGHNIKGIADNYLCNVSGKIYTLAYVDVSWGWTIN